MDHLVVVATFLFNWPGILLTMSLWFAPFLFIWIVVRPRQLQPLGKHFGGVVPRWGAFSGNLLVFEVANRQLKLKSQSSGGVNANRVQRTYYIATEVWPQPAFYVGHADLERYFSWFNLGSGKFSALLEINGRSLRIGSDEPASTQRLVEKLRRTSSTEADLELLFALPWSHLRVASKHHIGVGRVFECSYYGVPQDQVLQPLFLEQYARAFDRTIDVLLLKP